MIEAHVKIDKNIAVKGYRKALRSQALKDIPYFYASRLMIVWLVVCFANALAGMSHLSGYHGLFFLATWAGISVHGYRKWYREVGEMDGWEFYARVDELGVTTDATSETRNEWSKYSSYAEYDDYLQITETSGGITFLPKRPELEELIEFTKTKISEKN